ncbi:MAG: hypothetical protein ACRDHW_02130 [Ktedonobacteraceae bacterium]
MTRSDKGLVLATPRDRDILPSIAHHTIVRVDHLREMLSQAPGALLKHPETGLLAESTVKDQVDRWRRAGWIESGKVLADEPAYIWLTRQGLQRFGLDGLYRKNKPPSLLRFHHYWCILDVWLYWWKDNDSRGVEEWLPERRLRAEAMWVENMPEYHEAASIRLEIGSIPDAVVVGPSFCDAIEVQLTPLKPSEMKEKVEKILHSTYRLVETDKVYIYNNVHFYVPSDAMKRHIEAACKHLEEPEKERVHIEVDTDYAHPTFRIGA